MDEYDVTADESVRRRMKDRFDRVATPAIVIGQRVFWGFEYNKAEIAELLGVAGPLGDGRDGEG